MMDDVVFPESGDFFFVTCKDRNDRSYRDCVFQCLDSDDKRVVAIKVHGWDYSGLSRILCRDEWRMDEAKHLIPSLGISVTEKDAV